MARLGAAAKTIGKAPQQVLGRKVMSYSSEIYAALQQNSST